MNVKFKLCANEIVKKFQKFLNNLEKLQLMHNMENRAKDLEVIVKSIYLVI